MAELFNITHDANNLDEYDVTVIDGGDLSTGLPGLASTTARMEVLIDDQAGIYGQKNQGAPASNIIRFRFYIDPNTLTMANGDSFRILRVSNSGAPWTLAWVNLTYWDQYRIVAYGVDDADTPYNTGNINIADAEHYVEIQIERAANDGSNDGTFTVWVDGNQEYTKADIDNFHAFALITNLQLGAISDLDVGTHDTLYLDELKANDDGGAIGPVLLGQPMMLRGTTVPHIGRQWHPRVA